MGQVSEFLERGHLVSDRRARDTEARVFRDRLAAHRLALAHVLLDDGTKHRALARTQVGTVSVGHGLNHT
jgi:hypothetical protein